MPLVTILTDMADYPPHFWIEKQPQYLICGTDKAAAQALAAGHELDRVFRTSGMILRPEFYAPQTTSRPEGLRRLGLDPDVPTGMVMFGSEGFECGWRRCRRLGEQRHPIAAHHDLRQNQKIRERVGAMRTRTRFTWKASRKRFRTS